MAKTQITAQMIHVAVRSTECPTCRLLKRKGDLFCRNCYGLLEDRHRIGLRSRSDYKWIDWAILSWAFVHRKRKEQPERQGYMFRD